MLVVICIILGIIAFLLMEHPITFWCVFVPLAIVFIIAVVNFLTGKRGHIGNLLMVLAVFLAMIVAIVVVATPDPDKCDHDNLGKRFSFAASDSTASSSITPFCDNCNNYFGYTLFNGTPNDTSYLAVIEGCSSGNEIHPGEYCIVKAKVSVKFYYPSISESVSISCKVEKDGIIVGFPVEFQEEFRERVSLLQEGDEITFRGRFYDKGCGFTDCELITE